MSVNPPRAALVLIGDELLTAQVGDSNGTAAIRALRDAGIELVEMVYVRDDLGPLTATIRRVSAMADFTITSGGIGPTHDDRTIAAVAAAFGVPLIENAELAKRIREVTRDHPERRAAFERLALLPEGATFIDADDLRWPIYLARNVYMLPGLPSLFEAQLPVVLARHESIQPTCVSLYLSWGEGRLVAPLDIVVAAHAGVKFGSYPHTGEAYRTRITIEARDPAAVDAAVDDLLCRIDDVALLSVERAGPSNAAGAG